MKILLVSDNKDLTELLSFQISSQHQITVKECASAAEALAILMQDEKAVDLVIAPATGQDSPLLQHLRERKTIMPVIFFAVGPGVPKMQPGMMNGALVLGSVEHNQVVEGISKLLGDYLAKGGSTQGLEEFCPIRTTLLIRATPLRSDIYIRLSKEKFVRLFASGDAFDHNDLERYYQEKGVEYMYLRRTETGEFIQQFRRELDALLSRNDLKQEEGLKAAEVSQEAIQELIQRVGFTEEVQELAKKNVELTLKSIGSHPRLKDIIGRVTKEGNYLSQHSTMLSHISCCVAKEMEWGSDSTFSKLVLASYMHDASVSDPEMARINTIRELEEKKDQFPADAVKAYHLHPARSGDLVRSFKEIPADVDVIVMQHHERPNSSGFPRGLSHNYIAPLSALFIIAHDLTQNILEQKEKFSLADFVDDKKSLYNQGNFKKVMTALEKVKL